MDMRNPPLLRTYEETARPLGKLHALNPLKLLCEVAKRIAETPKRMLSSKARH
jgi:hypothetical protein